MPGPFLLLLPPSPSSSSSSSSFLLLPPPPPPPPPMADRSSSSPDDSDPSSPDISGSSSVEPKLWHACAGSQVHLPPVSSSVIYFPQGHAEHAALPPDFSLSSRCSTFSCRVLSVRFLADKETDEVFARIRLQPDSSSLPLASTPDSASHSSNSPSSKIASFAKTLTQSDANNGGGFSVPRYCAETIFPRLDYSEDPPVQIVLAKDVHGRVWKFRHIYRGTPRRHLLTTGWSNFVNHKKLVAGDAIVFLRTSSGELCVGVRRCIKGVGGNDSSSSSSSWHQLAAAVTARSLSWGPKLMETPYNFLDTSGVELNHHARPKPDMLPASNNFARNQARVTVESVVQAVSLAASGEPFEVLYYPRTTVSEFFVEAGAVKASLQHRWAPGLRFKMAVETEDASRVSWFVGTVLKVDEVDPVRWPHSPWKILQVTWDEPDLLQGITRVSPWQVEIISPIQMPQITFPKKKLRFSQPSEIQFDGQGGFGDLSMPSLATDNVMQKTLHPPTNSCVLTSMQGARQDHNFGVFLQPSKCQPIIRSLLSDFYQPRESTAPGMDCSIAPDELHERDFFYDRCPSIQSDFSTSLVVGSTSCSQPTSVVSCNRDGSVGDKKAATFVLFGKTIDTSDCIRSQEPQLSGGTQSPDSIMTNGAVLDVKKPFEMCDKRAVVTTPNHVELSRKAEKFSFQCSQHEENVILETPPKHCKVYSESDDVGRSIDLSSFSSFEELYERLESMYGAEKYQFLNRLVYLDSGGCPRSVGEEPYWDFLRNARRLKILSESSSESVTKCKPK